MSTSESNTLPLKVCTKCGSEFPATPEFWNKHKGAPDGLTWHCKVCLKAAGAAWRKAHPDHYSTYYAAHRAEKAAADAARHAKNYVAHPKPKLYDLDAGTRICSACGQLFPATVEFFHPDKKAADGLRSWCRDCSNAANRKAYQANPEPVIAHQSAYRRANPEKRRILQSEWREANREKWRATHAVKQRRRRARKKGSAGTHTAHDIRRIYNDQDGLCFWCDCELGGDWHVDHLEPLARGGSDGPENLVIACPSCNQRKCATDPMDFLERMCAL